MTFTDEYWSVVVQILQPFPCLCRVKWLHDDATDWQRPVFSPAPGYLEIGSLGPVPMREVEWIEIQSTESRHAGRLVPDSLIDHSSALHACFAKNSLHFESIEHGFRVYPAPPIQNNRVA
jgi:hypothetical protein